MTVLTKEFFEEKLNQLATKKELEKFATKEDLKNFPTKNDLRNELRSFATKDDLKNFQTKDVFATLSDEVHGLTNDMKDVKLQLVEIRTTLERVDKRYKEDSNAMARDITVLQKDVRWLKKAASLQK